MSRRRSDASTNANTGGGFNLVSISSMLPEFASSVLKPVKPSKPPPSGLSFKFNSLNTLNTSTTSSTSSTNSTSSTIPAIPSIPATTSGTFSKIFAVPPNTMSANPSSNSSNSEKSSSSDKKDIMHLTALVDDLSNRLNKAVDAKMFAETQLNRLSGALVQERAAAAARVQSLRFEIIDLQKSEADMKVELSQKPVIKEVAAPPVPVKQFDARVKTVIEAEELQIKLKNTQESLSTTEKNIALMNEQLNVLDEKRIEGIQEMIDDPNISVLSAEEVGELLEKAANARLELNDTHDRKTVVEEDLVRLEALRTSKHDEVAAAGVLLDDTNLAVTQAVMDERATRDMLEATNKELTEIKAELEQAKMKLQTIRSTVNAPSSFTVTGALTPAALPSLTPTACGIEERVGSFGQGVPNHFLADVGEGIEAAAEAAPEMVDALVADLKSYFENAIDVHRAIGASGASGVASVG